MDTKWNRMDKDPGEALERFVAEEVREAAETGKGVTVLRPGGQLKAFAGFLAFVLGVSLTVSSLGNLGARMVWERDLVPRFVQDWQETENFRQEIASCLKDFLTIGAGGKLNFYDYSYWLDYGTAVDRGILESEAVQEYRIWQSTEAVSGFPIGSGWASSDSSSVSVPDMQEPEEEQEPDAAYQQDKNILYYIDCNDGKTYTNGTFSQNDLALFQTMELEGYNFYLTFRNGRASITKDGQEVDVYGSGVYDESSQWFVPGYDNFPATDQLDGVTVYMAVRETPIRYYSVDYRTGSSYNSSSLYYIAQRVEETQRFHRVQAALFGCGALCLAVWLCLRKATVPVNRKLASWTLHIGTEARFVLILICLVWTFLPGLAATDIFWTLRYGYAWDYAWDYGYSFSDIASQSARFLLANVPGLLALVWLSWLIHNDHKYNPKEDRRSLLRPFLRALRARDLKRPVEKRLSRAAAVLILCAFLMGAELITFLIIFSLLPYEPLPYWSLWTLFLLPVLLGAAAISLYQRRQWNLARDLGRLADQVEAVRAGDLMKPLDLPKDADLRQTAESLNDIQAGMRAALEEQTRSERMKVELVSNVSHDLKTPLTSILSYAELLRQEEDLPPAAADYARIIDEKAQRLKSMVEDVFEVSKAAADQLPVRLEQLDLAKLLRQTLADMDGPIQKSALAFKVELPEKPVMITADGRRLYRVFQNLLDNALRYALEGSRVYLSLKTEGGSAGSAGLARASVRNTSRNELPEGVDFTARFVRGDASRTDGGSGLGLSIAKSFTEACGGTFRVETVADLFTATATFPITE